MKKKKIVGKKKISKAKKKVGVLRTKCKIKKDITAGNIFNSSGGKTDALLVSSPTEKIVNAEPASLTSEAPESAVLQAGQTEAEFACIDNKEVLDLSNITNPTNMADYLQAPIKVPVPIRVPVKENKFSGRKLFSLSNALRSLLVGLIFAGMFCTSVYVFATYGVDEPFPPNYTSDPNCLPTDSFCTVASFASYSFGTNNFSGTGNFTTTGGTIQAGAFIGDGSQVTNIAAANITGLATVATSGAYADLSGKPQAGTDFAPATSGTAILKGNGSGGFSSASAGTDYVIPSVSTLSSLTSISSSLTGLLTASTGALSAAGSGDVTSALGFTPYNATNPSGYQTAGQVTTYVTGLPVSTFSNDSGYQTAANVTSAISSALTPYSTTSQANALYYPLSSNPSNYLTSITGSEVTTALGYTPYNATNPSGYQTAAQVTSYVTGLGYLTTETDPDSIHLDQTSPQTFTHGTVTGTGLLKVTAGQLGLDTNTYLTAITSSQITSALGFTPYNATNPSGYQTAGQVTTYVTGLPVSTFSNDSGYQTAANVTSAISSALTPYSTTSQANALYYPLSSNPSNYLTSITGSEVTTALGYTPYNATNPSNYISGVVADSPLSGAGTSASHLTVDLSSKQNASSSLTSLAGLTYASPSFVKMTGANTFSLDTNTYLTSADLSGYVPYTGANTPVNLGSQNLTTIGTGTFSGLTSNGDVHISETYPYLYLDSTSGSGANEIVFTKNSGSDTLLSIYDNGGYGNIHFVSTGYGAGNGTFTFMTPGGSNLVLNADGTSTFAGNVGLGNSNLTTTGTVTANNFVAPGGLNDFFAAGGGNTTMSGSSNNFIGNGAGVADTSGPMNNFLGFFAGNHNTTGYSNNFIGEQPGYSNTTGYRNNFIGSFAGYFNTTGNTDNFLGYHAGNANTTGSNNNFIGGGSGNSNATGSGNVFLGDSSGYNQTTTSNLFIVDNQNRGSAMSELTGSLLVGTFNPTATNQTLNVNGKLGILDGSGSYHTILQGGTQSADITYTLPTANTSGILRNTSGTLSWDNNSYLASVNVSPPLQGLGTPASPITIDNGAADGITIGVVGFPSDNFHNANPGIIELGDGSGNITLGGTGSFANLTLTGSGSVNLNNQFLMNGATNPGYSNFIGQNAGSSATSASDSNFIGYYAGYNATNASYSTFLGEGAGYAGTSDSFSTFLGYKAGDNAHTAKNSIFVGAYAGINDGVDNTSNSGTSIAIGRYSGTGGFSDSVALGHGVTNSAATQMNLGNVININGIYNSDTQSSAFVTGATVNLGSNALTTTGKGSFGTFQLGTSTTAGYVLTADASGNGTWQAAAASGVPYTGATSDVDLGSHNLTTTGTGTFGAVNSNGTVHISATYPYLYLDSTSGSGANEIVFTKNSGSDTLLRIYDQGGYGNIHLVSTGYGAGNGTFTFMTPGGSNLVLNSDGTSTFAGNVGLGSSNLTTTGTGTFGGASSLTLGTASTNTGSIILKNSTNSNTLTINSGATAVSYAITMPTAQGGASTVLTNDGSGNLSWASAGGAAYSFGSNNFTGTGNFTTTGTLTGDTLGLLGGATSTGTVQALVVAGGGGGGGNQGGGGGAGGVTYNSSYTVTVASSPYTVTVGTGGTAGGGGGGTPGTQGGSSTFGTITTTGGGFGAGAGTGGTDINAGGTGGSGGGGSNTGALGTGTAGQGNNGSAGTGTSSCGAGGGANAAASGKNGGAGVSNSISGSAVTYGGGGGGNASGTGGAGGGGAAGNNTTGTSGTANTGGGGGGGGGANHNGGAGGSGVVVISYPTASMSATVTGTVATTTSGLNTIQTFTGNGTFTVTSGGPSSAYSYFQASGSQASTINYTLPASDAAGALTNNGSGTLSWGTTFGSVLFTPGTYPSSTTAGYLYFDSGANALKVCTSGTCSSGTGFVTITTSSSLRYKHDIQPLTDDWSRILQVQPKSFVYNGDPDSVTNIGYIAEDFDALGLTDLVQYDNQGRPNGINYDRVSLYDTEIIKQQQLDINALKQRLGIPTEATTITPAGTSGNGTVSGVTITPFDQSIGSSLSDLGATLSEGVMTLKNIIADSLTVKTARVNGIEMVDSVTGDVYCTWIANGQVQNVKGNCSDAMNTATVSTSAAPSSAAATTSTTTSSTETTQSQTSDQTTQSAINIAQQAADAAQQAADAAQQTADQVQQTQSAAEQASNQAQQAQTAAQQAQQTANQAQQTAQQTQQRVEQQPQAVNITSVASIPDINVAYGADISSANLPTTVNVTLSDNTNQTVSVTWDNGTPAYDPNTSGTYVFSGTLTFSGNITNTSNLKASVNVIVAQEPAPDQTGDLIQNAAASLINGVWNVIKYIFNSGLKAASSVPVMQKTMDELAQASGALQSSLSLSEIKSWEAGLLEPIVNILKLFAR